MSASSPPRRTFSWSISLVVVALVALLLLPSGLVLASGPNGTLRGFVTSASTGAAVSGASVRITASDVPWLFQATTDVSGSFALSLPNHVYTIEVTSPAFFLNSTTFRIGSGQTLWFNMSLEPVSARSALLQGYVKDAATSAAVTVGRVGLDPPYWYSDPKYANSSALDSSGYYAIRMTPGTYDLSTDGVLGYIPYSYSYIYLNSGQVRWYNFTMTAAPLTSWVNGTVRDDGNNTPIAGATVNATVSGLLLGSTTTNATGSFSFQVPVATVVLTADALGYAPNTANVYVYWAGSFTATVYLLPLTAGIRGYVRDGLTGQGLAGILVAPAPLFSNGYTDQVFTDAAGHFMVPLTADYYTVDVTATGYTSSYAYAYLYMGGVQWLNITLWPLVSTVRGYLTDGSNGLPVASWGVQGYDGRSGFSAYQASDASGLYSLALPPSPAITLTVVGYAPYVGAVEYVTTVAYGTVWVNITLQRVDAQLSVNVTDGITGLPISGASLSASWRMGVAYGTTDSTGVGWLGVPSGLALTVSAWASGYTGRSVTLDPITTSAQVSIALFPAWAANVTVQGYVRDAVTNGSLSFAAVHITGFGGSSPWDYTDAAGYYQIATVAYPQTVRATAAGYAAGMAAINPTASETIWLNFSLTTDSVDPIILDFTATPGTNLGPANPAALVAHVNESNFDSASLSLYMLQSSLGSVGTFVRIEQLPASEVSYATPSPGNTTVSTSWDTRTPMVRLTDGASSDSWPASFLYSPFESAISGYWENATISSPTSATAYFDTRSGDLLYLIAYLATGYEYIMPADQPSSTFQAYALGVHIDLTTAVVGSYVLALSSTYQLGSLRLISSNAVPGGQYAAVLQATDAGGNSAFAATFMQVTADTTPPVARAGPDQTVDQGAIVTLDGTASTDNAGIVNYTWTFTDGAVRVLYGATVTYRFQNAGNFAVTLTTSDAAGNQGSDTLRVLVRDTTDPTVSFTAPAESANVSGTITLTTSVSDNVGVVRVEFFADGTHLGTSTSAPFSFALNTASLSTGAHTLTAVAYDAAGNNATATLHVNISHTGGDGILGTDSTLWILLILLVVAVAGAILILVVLRRRRPRTPTIPPPMNPPAH